jgi:hypothetical protein
MDLESEPGNWDLTLIREAQPVPSATPERPGGGLQTGRFPNSPKVLQGTGDSEVRAPTIGVEDRAIP